MTNNTQIQTHHTNKSMPLWAYIDGKKRKIGYGYFTKNGSLCIKGDRLLDKNQLGKLLINGLYVHPPNE